MIQIAKCILCRNASEIFFSEEEKDYYRCDTCLCLFMDPAKHPSSREEKARYQEHNNDVNDPRYQKFVSPIVSAIEGRFSKEHRGLDFGAGTGPVITKLLRYKGFSIEVYDPFFWNKPSLLHGNYDYIACCEVMEHFHNPAQEFALLRSLLEPGGALFCKTDLYQEDIDFSSWYYRNDITHVIFYHEKTLQWIKTHFNFKGLELQGRLIRFDG